MSNAYSPAFEAACEVVEEYIRLSAKECKYTPPFKALLLVCGNEDFLLSHSKRITRNQTKQEEIDGFKGCKLYDEDAIFGLFSAMNPTTEKGSVKRINHEDGAIILDRYGEVLDAGVRLIYHDFGGIETPAVDERIMQYKQGNNVGLRHSAALRMTMYPEVDGAIVSSESVCSMIPFAGGDIVENKIWVPPEREVVTGAQAEAAAST